MSAQRKPRRDPDGNAPAMSRLKMLAASDREDIYRMCQSDKPLQEIRGEIRERFGISLSSDSQLSRFKDWQYHQQRTERLNSTLENFEEFYAEQNPDATRETIRERAMSLFMAEAAASGDRSGFLDVAQLDLAERSARTKARFKERELTLGEQKFQWDAAEACLKELPFIKSVSNNKSLSQNDKIEAIRKRLWGNAPVSDAAKTEGGKG